MRASDLRKKHYEYWVDMEAATWYDLIGLEIDKKTMRRIAYNAAFNATLLYHRAIWKRKKP